MKIFAIYLRFNLTQKPEWFDEFRSKYSSTSILHITLIQPRYVSEDRIEYVKSIVMETLEKYKFNEQDKKLIFSKTELEKENNGNYILMTFIRENKSIFDLQKFLLKTLEEFNNYCDEETMGYESNFRPHLTIADRIAPEFKEETLKYITEDSRFEGNIKDLVLAVVKEQTISESEDFDNWHVFDV